MQEYNYIPKVRNVTVLCGRGFVDNEDDLHEDVNQESQSGVMLKGGGGVERVEGKGQGLVLFLQ